MIDIENTMNRVYWDTIRESVKNNDYEIVFNNIKEMRQMLLNFIPESNKKREIMEEFNEYFDIEFIKERIDNKTYGDLDFINLSSYINDWVIKLQAPVDNVRTKKKFETLVSIEYEREDKYVNILRHLLSEVNNIKENLMFLSMVNKINA